MPSGELDQVLGHALDTLLRDLERKKFAATEQPRAAKPRAATTDPRRVPNDVKRAVHARDGEQCAFISEDGERCTERGFLELDHVVPVARGGEPTVPSTRLLCAGHNQYEADRTLGAAFMQAKRARAQMEADVILGLRGLGWTAADDRRAVSESAHVSATTIEDRMRAALAVLHIRYTSRCSEACAAPDWQTTTAAPASRSTLHPRAIAVPLPSRFPEVRCRVGCPDAVALTAGPLLQAVVVTNQRSRRPLRHPPPGVCEPDPDRVAGRRSIGSVANVDVALFWTTLSDMIEGGRPIGETEAWIYTMWEGSSLTEAVGDEAALDLVAFDFRGANAAGRLRARWRALATERHPLLWVGLRARRLAAGLLDGSIDLVDGCEELHGSRTADEQADLVPMCFTAWASELDDVPPTRARDEWESGALAEKLAKVSRHEDDILVEARALLDRLEPLIARYLGLG